MNILELRKSLKLSRKEFSELYKMPYNTVTQWERGERTPPAYLIKLIKENIKLKTKGEQINIDEEFIFCNIIKRYNSKGDETTWKTYFPNQEAADKEWNYFDEFNKKYNIEQKFSLERRVYKRI